MTIEMHFNETYSEVQAGKPLDRYMSHLESKKKCALLPRLSTLLQNMPLRSS